MTKPYIGLRREHHLAHMAAVKAVQRRGQLERVNRVLSQHIAWHRAGVDLEGSLETIQALSELRHELEIELEAMTRFGLVHRAGSAGRWLVLRPT